MIDHLVENLNQSPFEEGKETVHEPRERTIMALKLTEKLGHIETASKVFEDADLNEQ